MEVGEGTPKDIGDEMNAMEAGEATTDMETGEGTEAEGRKVIWI
jgi:hypothetical protein